MKTITLPAASLWWAALRRRRGRSRREGAQEAQSQRANTDKGESSAVEGARRGEGAGEYEHKVDCVYVDWLCLSDKAKPMAMLMKEEAEQLSLQSFGTVDQAVLQLGETALPREQMVLSMGEREVLQRWRKEGAMAMVKSFPRCLVLEQIGQKEQQRRTSALQLQVFGARDERQEGRLCDCLFLGLVSRRTKKAHTLIHHRRRFHHRKPTRQRPKRVSNLWLDPRSRLRGRGRQRARVSARGFVRPRLRAFDQTKPQPDWQRLSTREALGLKGSPTALQQASQWSAICPSM